MTLINEMRALLADTKEWMRVVIPLNPTRAEVAKQSELLTRIDAVLAEPIEQHDLRSPAPHILIRRIQALAEAYTVRHPDVGIELSIRFVKEDDDHVCTHRE